MHSIVNFWFILYLCYIHVSISLFLCLFICLQETSLSVTPKLYRLTAWLLCTYTPAMQNTLLLGKYHTNRTGVLGGVRLISFLGISSSSHRLTVSVHVCVFLSDSCLESESLIAFVKIVKFLDLTYLEQNYIINTLQPLRKQPLRSLTYLVWCINIIDAYKCLWMMNRLIHFTHQLSRVFHMYMYERHMNLLTFSQKVIYQQILYSRTIRFFFWENVIAVL